MDELQLGLATADAIAALTAIHAAAFAEDVRQYGQGPAGVGDAAWHRERLADHTYLALRLGQRLIGGLIVEERGADEAFLDAFFIDPAEHNRGYGRRALRLLEQKFPHVRRWTLYTPHRSFRNHHVYERAGYHKIGEVQVPAHPDLAPDFVLFEYERLLDA